MTEFTIGTPLPARIDGGYRVACWHCGAQLGYLRWTRDGEPCYEAPRGYEVELGPGGLPLFQPGAAALQLRRRLRRAASDPDKRRRFTARAYLEQRRGVDPEGEVAADWPSWRLRPVLLPALARCERCQTLNRVEVDARA